MIGIYEIINIVNGKRYIGSSISIDIGVSIQSICDNLKGRTKLTKGKYILEYVDMSKILK